MGLFGNANMRNLDKENPSFASPQSLGVISALLPIMIGGMCSLLASIATPRVSLLDNPISVFCICLSCIALLGALMPKIFKWGWRSEYFGFPTFYVASLSLFGIIPWLCILVYGGIPLGARIALLCSYAIPTFWWCRRFVHFYRGVFSDKPLRDFIYLEEFDAVYYSQQNDKFLLERKRGLRQFPSNLAFLIPLALGFCLTPFSRSVYNFTGISFTLTFLTIIGLPITVMILGLTTRCLLIYYFYPWKIKRQTGKDVYVDMVTKTTMPRKK
jgi:hypothetical protein